MSYSLGQNFNTDLLNVTNQNNEDCYVLQSRLSNFFKNNPSEVLLMSEKYSGETTKLNGGNKVPLGGPIDYSQDNYVNAQGTGFCSKEFDFFNMKKDSFTNTKNTKNTKEYFGDTISPESSPKSTPKSSQLIKKTPVSSPKTIIPDDMIDVCKCLLIIFVIILIGLCIFSCMKTDDVSDNVPAAFGFKY